MHFRQSVGRWHSSQNAVEPLYKDHILEVLKEGVVLNERRSLKRPNINMILEDHANKLRQSVVRVVLNARWPHSRVSCT